MVSAPELRVWFCPAAEKTEHGCNENQIEACLIDFYFHMDKGVCQIKTLFGGVL